MPSSSCLRRIQSGLIALALSCVAVPALAQADRCPKLVAEAPARIIPAAFRLPAAPQEALFRLAAGASDEVTLNYIGHSTFLIETAGGVTVATDYNDYVHPDVVPRVATMNRAHSTHYSLNPDPGIEYVLKGWSDTPGQPARYDLDVGDLWVGNLATNTRDWEGGTTRNGNSIFVFRAADLCIAHLGHLHHTLTEDDIAALGRIDVVLAPVDGSYTLDVDGMVEVLRSLESPLVIPMHYFNETTLNAFLNRLGAREFVVERNASSTLSVSRESLPGKPTVIVLPQR
ncbi:MBL fold metallo-hydrolase [Ancylobacter defluvii]|uniref:Zn-dependent hydrolase n=1 Tax=Ancylobacter defluvii TaxID=1282440 RepID=A0A9W6JYC3_9HYPH|nr:MBL fold metallo-hydrolase [Ancylobacter defluvii]MBS7588966.1 MBL fold metallo-hydrolase [Ancylobacter defluvii]GLK84569.1 Zn-dependent hydrolase [Ancylobacter defluvii]